MTAGVTTTAPVAGWYTDPLDPDAYRYWNGTGWTEHTSGTAAPATEQAAAATPAAQPSAPQAVAQQIAPQPAPTQPLPAQRVASGEPFAYAIAPARPGPVRAPALYAHRPPGPSTGVRVLIGLAIAVGVLVVIGIIASIAIPVFLNERDKGSTTTSTAPAGLPETAAGLTRSESPESQRLTQQWMALPLPGTKSVGIYDDASGRHRAAVMLTRVDMTAPQQAEMIRGARASASTNGLTPFRTVSTGSLGGRMECASLTASNATVCVFADSTMGGAIDVFGSTTGDATAVRLRQAVEHRS